MEFDFIVEKTEDGHRLRLKGPLNEHIMDKLAKIPSELGKTYRFNFRDIEYINSMGARSWLLFMRTFHENRKIIFEECTSDIIAQINMVPRFAFATKIESFYGLFICDACDHEATHLFDSSKGADALRAEADTVKCPKCQALMELEDDKDTFFAFLDRAEDGKG